MGAAAGTIHGVLLDAARRHADRILQRVPRTGEEVSYAEFARTAERVARALRAAGVVPGDRVGLVAENSPRWLQADVGILAAGAVPVPRGTACGADEVAAILGHSGCRAAFVDDAATARRLGPALRGMAPLVVLHGPAPEDGSAAAFDDFLGSALDEEPLPEVSPDAVATLVYTSGTTGDPKGVTLLHRNVVSNVVALADVLPTEPGETFLSVLPTWHMYERTVEYFAASRGAVIAYTDLRHLRRDLAAVRPEYLPSVPRLWERLHDAVLEGVRESKGVRRRVAETLIAASLAHTSARLALAGRTAETVERPLGPFRRLLTALRCGALLPLHALATRTIHRRIREATGGRLRAAISGGAALPPHVDRFFAAADVTVLVGYGLTETSPVVAVRRCGRNVLGTIGTPLAETALRVVDPLTGSEAPEGAVGVLQVRGPQVMRGYWRNEAATSRVLSADGWFDTGDLCRLTPERDIVFCGRAKDTIVLIGGENVEPEPLEQAAMASPVLEQVVLVGQDRKTLGALVWARTEAVAAALGTDPEEGDVLRLVRSELDRRLGPAAGFRPWERAQHVALLPEPLSPENGLLTATLKTRRAAVAEHHRELIDAMYRGDGRR